MREILFKAKRIKTGEWSIGYLVSIDEINVNTYGGHNIIWHHVDPETVCQFTGLKDKNGNMIFEGDTLRYHDETTDNSAVTVFVVWNQNTCSFLMKEKHKHGVHREFTVADRVVIGNIHDDGGDTDE